METLLDHHLPTFDRWLQVHFMSLTASSWRHHYLTVVALLDQLGPKAFNSEQVGVILHCYSLPIAPDEALCILFDGKEFNIEFIRIVSKFLMDRDRAGSLWVESNKYAVLTVFISQILRDKCVYSPCTLKRANMNFPGTL